MSWKPSAELTTLRHRSETLAIIRRFFRERDVLEVETPCLGTGNVPDPEVTGLSVEEGQGLGDKRHLQTSPEIYLKRFIAAQSVHCFELTKAFRWGELGRRHNPEFTLLEWYRVGWTLEALVREVLDLTQAVHSELAKDSALSEVHYTYRQLFQNRLGLDPLLAADSEVERIALAKGAPDGLTRDGCLSYLLSHSIEPSFERGQLSVVMDFPPNQAALAQLQPQSDGTTVARRFEVYLGSVELANGYLELTEVEEQRARFDRDHEKRNQAQLPSAGDQESLLQALEYGLPDCVGVALGVDRLLMAVLGKSDIGEVMSFR